MNKIISLLVLCLLTTALPALCNGHIDRPHDWTVEIETDKLPRQFDYHNSHLSDVVKTNIDYYHQTDDAHKTPYEYLWFHSSTTLGMERLHKFQIDQGDGIAINIKHKTASPDVLEKYAAATALTQIVLDAYMNKNAVTIVNVPQESYTEIVNQLQSTHHFITQADAGADHPVDSGINIFVQSDAGNSQTLYYF